MMAERSDHGRPLAPAANRVSSDENNGHSPISMEYFKGEKKLRRRRCIVKCCGCITALFLIITMIALALIFTVFHVKTPNIEVNSITIENLKLGNGTLTTADSNITLIADVAVKNPNYVSFKFDNTTTTIYYHGASIGEGWSPQGQVKARMTMETNVTVDITSTKILGVPNWSTDASFGEMNFSSYTKISGRIKIVKTIQKNLVVNCTMTVNLTTLEVHDMNCHRHVSLVED